MNEETKQKLKEIKQRFRLVMNGPASQSMREKGLNYKVNWGVPLPELRRMAKDYGHNYALAIELWKEDIRECKVLATLIMPPERMSEDLVDVWMEQNHSQEMAELLAMNLLQYLSFAPVLAYKWIATDDTLRQLTGYSLLSRLFMKGQEPNERGVNEFLDQARAVMEGSDAILKHAAYNCLLRFCELGDDYATIAGKAMKGLDIL